MAKPIKIIVVGSGGLGEGAPTVDDLLSQVQDQVKILREVEGAIADDGNEELEWRVTNVSQNSPITFEVTPYPKTFGMDIERRANQVVSATAYGLETLSLKGERPRHFTDTVLKTVHRLSERVVNGLASSKLDFSEYQDAPNYEINSGSAKFIQSQILELKQPKSKPYRELGSTEGFIKTVGRDGYGRPNLLLTTRLDGQDVKCTSSDGGLDKIDHLEVGKVIRGMRVRVHGTLFFKSPGFFDRIDVDRIETFDVASLPTLHDLIDPDFTGGLEAVEFIQRRRQDA